MNERHFKTSASIFGFIAAMVLASLPAHAQSVSLEEHQLYIRDATGTPQVAFLAEVILEAELRVVGPGPDIQDLIDQAAPSAGPARPYVIRLGPGVYTLTSQLTMAEYVSLAGSGEEATRLTGAVSAGIFTESALVQGANHMSITDLTIENTGSGSNSVAISNESASPEIRRVTAVVLGANSTAGIVNSNASPIMDHVSVAVSGVNNLGNLGVVNSASSSPTMTHMTITASGGATNYGVLNGGSSPIMTAVFATATGGTNLNVGIDNSSSSSPTLVQVTAIASGGTENYGVRNNSSAPTLLQVTAIASGGTNDYGVHNNGGATPTIQDSELSGTTAGIRIGSTGARVANTRIIGGVALDPSGPQCRGTYDQNLTSVNC